MVISIHNNSADKGNPHGANVFYPNSSYNAEVGKKGKELALSILKKLVELGIANDGVHIGIQRVVILILMVRSVITIV